MNINLFQSHAPYIQTSEGSLLLDCYTQCCSNPFPLNFDLEYYTNLIYTASLYNIANSDIDTHFSNMFKGCFEQNNPDFKYFFYCSGGSVAVENAMKIAFDYKYKKLKNTPFEVDQDWYETHVDVLHFEKAFHGRTGYCLSITNTTPDKTDLFPKLYFTRLKSPIVHLYKDSELTEIENEVYDKIENTCINNTVACLVMELIQGEGGDNHFRPEFIRKLWELSNKYDFLFIADEVQTGFGLTGKFWAYEHFDIVPDIVVFGKKMQVCGCMCTSAKLDSISNHVFKSPVGERRINSTWGGDLTAMVRSHAYFKLTEKYNLVTNVEEVGQYLLEELKKISTIKNVRGRGLFCAFETTSESILRLSEKVIFMKSHNTVRLRPPLTFSRDHVDLLTTFIRECTC